MQRITTMSRQHLFSTGVYGVSLFFFGTAGTQRATSGKGSIIMNLSCPLTVALTMAFLSLLLGRFYSFFWWLLRIEKWLDDIGVAHEPISQPGSGQPRRAHSPMCL
ncbi:hypothetical protein B0T22DRAFT_87571 [Podospora appendiculata]|uniref:Uncharacterized protein n=1 Tax=Podospora appendiculata TaxID=314037 RepID=A0AAE0XKG5_9PEZI|nr:hypothetical protein B0T22DRAFT_87571 [Podospora appendiculata]